VILHLIAQRKDELRWDEANGGGGVESRSWRVGEGDGFLSAVFFCCCFFFFERPVQLELYVLIACELYRSPRRTTLTQRILDRTGTVREKSLKRQLEKYLPKVSRQLQKMVTREQEGRLACGESNLT
jgi:hypothetical protein